MSHEAQLRAAIRCLLPQAGEATAADLRYRPLGGGVGGRTYLVGGLVVRLPDAAARHAALADPAAEHALMSAAAAAGLAPPVTAADHSTGLLITQYLSSARPWTEADARAPDNIVRIAALLRALHGLSAQLAPYAPLRTAERYLVAQTPSGSEEVLWAEELLRRARAYEARWPPSVPCHNDLTAANILDNGNLRLVDFEYAALAAPVLDLAGLAGMNGYDAAQRRLLIDAYYAGSSAPFGAAELDEVVRMVRLLSYFWTTACGGFAAEPAPYRRLGEQFAAVLRRNEA